MINYVENKSEIPETQFGENWKTSTSEANALKAVNYRLKELRQELSCASTQLAGYNRPLLLAYSLELRSLRAVLIVNQ